MKIGSVVTVRERPTANHSAGRWHRSEVPNELCGKRGVILEFDANLKRATVRMYLNPTLFSDSEIVELKTFKIPIFYLETAKPRDVVVRSPVVRAQGTKVFILEEDIPFLRSAVGKLSLAVPTPALKGHVALEISTLNSIIDRYEESE